MKFVHDDRADFGVLAAGQGDVGEDLGRAAQDGSAGINGGVAGHHADVLRAEVAAEAEEFFVHQRLDRAGVDRALAGAEGLEMQRGGNQRFAGAGRGVEDDVAAGEEFQDGLLLLGIERQPALGHRLQEGVEHRIGIG